MFCVHLKLLLSLTARLSSYYLKNKRKCIYIIHFSFSEQYILDTNVNFKFQHQEQNSQR